MGSSQAKPKSEYHDQAFQQPSRQDTRNSQSNQNRIVDQSGATAMFQWNWASFGGGITTVLICLVLCLLLCFFIRKNNRANSRARRSELHEILLLTGRGHHVNSRRHLQSGFYPPSAGYPGTPLGHSGRPNEPPPPYSAVQPSVPATNAINAGTGLPIGQPMSASFPGFQGVTYNPSSGVTIHPSGLPQLSWAANGSTVSVPAGLQSFQGASSLPAIAGPQLLVCLLYTSPSPRDLSTSRMPSSA